MHAETELVLGEFGRVRLTREQHAKLNTKLNGNLTAYVSRFDRWVNEAPEAKMSGVKRKDRHAYESICAWFDRDVKEGKVHIVDIETEAKPIQTAVHFHRCSICDPPHDWQHNDDLCFISHDVICEQALAERKAKQKVR